VFAAKWPRAKDDRRYAAEIAQVCLARNLERGSHEFGASGALPYLDPAGELEVLVRNSGTIPEMRVACEDPVAVDYWVIERLAFGASDDVLKFRLETVL